jgi:putative membrane protein
MYIKHKYSIKEVHLKTWINLLIVIIISTLTVYLYEVEKWDFLVIPVAIPTILGTTISLILAFRTNASYDRWWEARKIWGAIVNDSRSLVRQALVNFDKKELEQLANRQIGWNYILSNNLRAVKSQGILEKYLKADEL